MAELSAAARGEGPPAMVPVLGRAEGAELEVVASTEAFRQLARRRLVGSDCVLEIGCCRGHCTELLAEKAQEVLALDVSSDCVSVAAKRVQGSHVRVEQLDVLEHPEWLCMLGGRTPAFTVVFADIGGNRRLEHVARLLRLLRSSMPRVRYTALKSEAVAEALEAAPAEAGPREAWWEAFLARDHACSKRPLRPMQVIMAYPVRRTPDGREICRFANYGTCRKGAACAWAHSHCHCCGVPGHFASSCPSLLSSEC